MGRTRSLNDKRECGESVIAFTYVDFESVIVRSIGIHLENAMLRSMAILAVTLGFGAALADDFNYNYIDAGYARGASKRSSSQRPGCRLYAARRDVAARGPERGGSPRFLAAESARRTRNLLLCR